LKLIALIPAYRPDALLPQLARALLEHEFSAIIIVNDGSESEYNTIFENLSNISDVTVLKHAVNIGKGAAIKTGINHICGIEDADTGIITVDADGQHKVDDIINVARELRQNQQKLILGSRSFSGDVPFRSRFGNASTKFLLKIAHGINLTDTQTGLRGMSTELARNFLAIKANRYNFELDMLLEVKKLGVEITEISIETIYLDDNKSSHFNPVFDSAKIYFSLFRFSMASLFAALIDNFIFIVLFSFGSSILISQIGSRAVVMIINYMMVKKMVFHSAEQNKIAIPKYVMTVIILGTISYGLIIAASEFLALPVILAKILVETIVFMSSFLIQRSFIFKENQE
jgi:glycosyltransferase involved in cell wall biosynthesis